ncbi:MAG: DUF2249 domain-containing protein [Rubrivivax sp.]
MTSTVATLIPLDLRAIAPRERHNRVLDDFAALQTGESLQLLSDHDPQPLHTQLERRHVGQLAWAALEAGPALWRVQLTRTGAKPALSTSHSCCSGGACGG